MKLRYIATLLVTAGVAASIAAAPIAAAESSCTTVGSDTECASPGNVQINDAPPPAEYTPQYPYWEGGYGFIPGFGGFGGFGGAHGHR